jgi:hypothetical protein
MLKETFTDDKRAELQLQLTAIDRVIEGIEKQKEPFDRSIAQLLTLKEEIVANAAGAEIHGTCECGRILFYGEKAHTCEDGPLLCEDCAPTWNDLRQQYDADKELGGFVESFDTPEDAARADRTVDAHIAAGNGDKKHVWELS